MNGTIGHDALQADDLLLFARVIEAGSFTAAAQRVRLPKSTVSRRVAALEKRLGERLLQRTTRKLVLTDFGQGMLDHARGIAAEVDQALALALHRQALPSGTLRVSMPADFATMVLADMLAAFVRAYPAVALELDLSPRRVDLIGENFDLAVRMGTLPDDSQLAARHLVTLTVGLYAAPAYLKVHGEPQTAAALADLDGLLLLTRSGEPRPWSLRPAAGGADAPGWTGLPTRRVLANSPDVLMRLALRGIGVTAVGDFAAAPHVATGALVRVLPGWWLASESAWAVFPGRRLMPTRTRVFIDMALVHLAACPTEQTETPARPLRE